ncbi:hypothetical protein [Bradyrhizobium sp. AZCC 1620]|uniref:hypothetical protein n=1 Tax=unclassified Bradyrhizobium TaxID=2631580 RepID=UPI00307576B8
MEQMTMRSVDLDPFESNFGSPAGGAALCLPRQKGPTETLCADSEKLAASGCGSARRRGLRPRFETIAKLCAYQFPEGQIVFSGRSKPYDWNSNDSNASSERWQIVGRAVQSR